MRLVLFINNQLNGLGYKNKFNSAGGDILSEFTEELGTRKVSSTSSSTILSLLIE